MPASYLIPTGNRTEENRIDFKIELRVAPSGALLGHVRRIETISQCRNNYYNQFSKILQL